MEIDEKYVDNVKEFIAHQDGENVRNIIWNMHPADIAELCKELDVKEARYIYQLLDNEKAADVLSEMDDDERKELLEELDPEVIAKRFVDNMDTDDAVDMLRDLDEDKQEEVLSHIDDIEQAGDIVDLLKYDEVGKRLRQFVVKFIVLVKLFSLKKLLPRLKNTPSLVMERLLFVWQKLHYQLPTIQRFMEHQLVAQSQFVKSTYQLEQTLSLP